MSVVTNEPDRQAGVPRWLATAAALAWRLLVVAAGVFVLGEAFSRLQEIVVPVVVAIFASTVLAPPAYWLRRHGWPPLLATWGVFLFGLVVIGAIIFGLIPSVQSEFSALGKELSDGVNHVQHWLITGPLHLSNHQVSSYVKQAGNALTKNESGLLKGALSGVTVVFQVVAGVLLAMILTFFFVKDGNRMGDWFTGLFSDRRARDLRGLGDAMWRVLTQYIRGTAANGAINGAVMAVVLLVLGVPLVVPLALLTFVGGFIPLAGAIVSGLLAALVALVSQGFIAALVVIGATILIHNLEGYIVGPQVLGHAVRLHPVAIILLLSLGTILGGIVGTFLVVPVAAVTIAVVHYYRRAKVLVLEDAPTSLVVDRSASSVRQGHSETNGPT